MLVSPATVKEVRRLGWSSVHLGSRDGSRVSSSVQMCFTTSLTQMLSEMPPEVGTPGTCILTYSFPLPLQWGVSYT